MSKVRRKSFLAIGIAVIMLLISIFAMTVNANAASVSPVKNWGICGSKTASGGKYTACLSWDAPERNTQLQKVWYQVKYSTSTGVKNCSLGTTTRTSKAFTVKRGAKPYKLTMSVRTCKQFKNGGKWGKTRYSAWRNASITVPKK